ncbi:MAG: ABC transporter permease subunit [Aeromicrobium sp.]
MTGRTTWWQRLVLGALGILGVAAVWEGYKAVAPDTGVVIGDTTVLPRASDLAMPHVWTMVERLFDPIMGTTGDLMWQGILDAGLFSLRLAATGWVIGVVVGMLLALSMQRFAVAEASVLPWIVLSQTVPLVAIAPLVRRWGSEITIGGFEWESEHSVAVIAAYLAFFPVAVGALRGLKSPDATHLDLMHTYGIGWGRTLLRLRLPASVPHLLPALRLAAAAAVIGTVVAEVSIGLTGGIGRLVIEYAQSASSDPAKPWAPIFGAIAVGLVAAGFVSLIGLLLKPYRRSEVPA